MCVLYPQDQTQLTFHRVCRTQINHHLSRRPLPFTKFEQIFSHYILPLFWSHTKLIFLPLALFLYMLCSSVNHSYDSSSTLCNAKNFIPAFFSDFLSPSLVRFNFTNWMKKTQKSFSHRISSRIRCAPSVSDTLTGCDSPQSTPNNNKKRKSNKKMFIVPCNRNSAANKWKILPE